MFPDFPLSVGIYENDSCIGSMFIGSYSRVISNKQGQSDIGTWAKDTNGNLYAMFDKTYKILIEEEDFANYFYEAESNTPTTDDSSSSEQPSESGDTEKPDESGDINKPSESESEERFVDKASQWLDENLSVKVSSATIGAVIIIGVLILIFKRK